MAGASHQTIRLSRGRHRSPAQGACVMELASMLAGESFSDKPRCVDPVVAAFMRAFNDRLGHARRQDLRPYAALAVGSRKGRAAARRRRAACLAYASGSPRGGLGVRLRLLVLLGLRGALSLDQGAGEWAAREAVARGDEDGAFALLNELLEAAPLALPVVGEAELRVPALGAELVLEPHGAHEEQGGHTGDH